MADPRGWWTDEQNEKQFNQERANKWTDATISLSGTGLSGATGVNANRGTIHFSGSGHRIVGPLCYGMLYQYIGTNATHMVASSNPLQSASAAYERWPADVPKFHIPISGTSEYLSFSGSVSTYQFWLSIVENSGG